MLLQSRTSSLCQCGSMQLSSGVFSPLSGSYFWNELLQACWAVLSLICHLGWQTVHFWWFLMKRQDYTCLKVRICSCRIMKRSNSSSETLLLHVRGKFINIKSSQAGVSPSQHQQFSLDCAWNPSAFIKNSKKLPTSVDIRSVGVIINLYK